MLIIYSFVINIVLLLILTLIIATLTLVERKILSLMQRRVGPDFVGYRGRLQYIADALKMFIKGVLVPHEANKFWFVCTPALTLTISYSFWLNAVWGPSIAIFEIEYNLIYSSLFSALFTFCIILTGFFSRNKYSLLASIRAALGMLNLELFLGLFFLSLIVIGESFSILTFVNFQEIFWLFIPLIVVIGLIAITFLLEVNRTPFDLSEAESELVAGYTTEYGGFFFAIYYLGEYLHLFFFSLLVSSLVFGGWELPRFVLITVYDYFDTLGVFKADELTNFVYNFDEWIFGVNVYYALVFYEYFYFVYEFMVLTYELIYYVVLYYNHLMPDLFIAYKITLFYFFNIPFDWY